MAGMSEPGGQQFAPCVAPSSAVRHHANQAPQAARPRAMQGIRSGDVVACLKTPRCRLARAPLTTCTFMPKLREETELGGDFHQIVCCPGSGLSVPILDDNNAQH